MNTGTKQSVKATSSSRKTAPPKAASAPKAQPKAQPKKAAAVPAKKAASTPAKKTPAPAPAKKIAAPTPARRAPNREAMLARVESVRMSQRDEGHFDCFGRATQGYCDQGGCAYHAECMSVSGMLHSV